MKFPFVSLFVSIIISLILTIVINVIITSTDNVLPWWAFMIIFIIIQFVIFWIVANVIEYINKRKYKKVTVIQPE